MPHNSYVHLTRDEHEELGREIALTCRRMQEIATLLMQVYGPSNNTAFSAVKARDAMLKFYRDLAFQAEADLPGVKIDGYQKK